MIDIVLIVLLIVDIWLMWKTKYGNTEEPTRPDEDN